MEKPRYSMTKIKFTQYLSTNPDLQKIRDEKHQHKEGIYTLEKTNLLSTNPKENNHTNIKITGSNNHHSLISLIINGLNSQ